ncbi:MAG TPA: cell division protein ZapA [Lachnospiraceae bacterium]|nr:cell division protein ZapA [Lachnospiraceae bacterium]
MQDQTTAEVLIDGRTYTIAGFESDEYLQQVATYINRKLGELKKNGDYMRLDLDTRNALLAINIADDYFKEKGVADDIRGDRELKDKLVLDMKHEIIAREDQIDKDSRQITELQKKLNDAEKRIVELETTLKNSKGR